MAKFQFTVKLTWFTLLSTGEIITKDQENWYHIAGRAGEIKSHEKTIVVHTIQAKTVKAALDILYSNETDKIIAAGVAPIKPLYPQTHYFVNAGWRRVG